MSVVASSPKSKTPASKADSRSRGLLPLALAFLAAAFSFTPTAVHADTPVKGFFTDEEGPKADAKAEVAVTTTAQAEVEASVTVAVDDEFDVDTDPTALTDFREPLADYGTWTDDATYGTVWLPDTEVVGADFAPYQTAGHWELDENEDWMWVSDYDWGYIPFHYGRWVWIGGRGWGWIPGRVYAPAWVTWRMTDYGYIGWAPMAPSWYWFGGAAVNVWTTPYSAYVFCPSTYVFHRHVHTYVVRDRNIIQRIGAHSRPYRAARPSVRASGAGSSGNGARAYRPASPRVAEAKIPHDAAPQKRSKPDPRAYSYARKSTSAQARASYSASRRAPGAHTTPATRDPRGVRTNPGDGRPVTRLPSRDSSGPQVQPSRPAVNPSRPSVSPSRPSVSPSRPSVSPSRPSVSPSRPSVSPSRPSVSPSRPSVSPSRPSSPSRSISPSRPSSPSRSFSPSRPSGGRSGGRR
ncbi:MAG: hypothetical protein IPM54_31395 [Polyangiaceae bacterium]|nr:hypothetical protein [Polyangiaceae bacterium]